MHPSTVATFIFALAINPAFSAPIPRFAAAATNAPECEARAISFLEPRSQSIYGIRARCAEVRKRGEAITQRDISKQPAVSPMHLVPFSYSADANTDENRIAARDVPKFEIESPPRRPAYVVEGIPSSEETLVNPQSVDVLPKTAEGSLDLAAHAAQGNWRRVEYERHTVFIAVTGRRQNIVLIGAVVVLLVATILLTIEAIVSVGRRLLVGRPKRRQPKPSFIRIPAPTYQDEKKDDYASAGIFNEWMILDS